MRVTVQPQAKAQAIINDGHARAIIELAAPSKVLVSARGPQGPEGSGGGGGPILEASFLIEEDVTLRENFNGLSLGPVTIASGWSVTVPSGAYWMVL